MKPGTKPKPDAIKALEGVGKHRRNHNQPQPEITIPSCPAFLDVEAKAEWARITKELNLVGVISKLERAVLTGYCVLWSDLRRYIKDRDGTSPIIKTAPGTIVQNPLENLVHKTAERLLRYEVELGLTPSSRNRIDVKKYEPEDELDKFLNTRKN